MLRRAGLVALRGRSAGAARGGWPLGAAQTTDAAAVASGVAGLRLPSGLRCVGRRQSSTGSPRADHVGGRDGPLSWYQSQVSSGAVVEDSHQLAAAALLQSLHDDLCRLHGAGADADVADAAPPSAETSAEPPPPPRGIFSRLFGTSSRPSPAPQSRPAGLPSGTLGREGPRGVYLWGGVGCGKSMLMDAFFEASAVPPSRRRRVHFHEFMLEVHSRVHQHRQAKLEGDALLSVASKVAAEAQLLCFDEFQVRDVGDAMLMNRLFGRMFDRGVTMVATSNRPPEDLYAGGLQRELFEPFIHRVKERCLVHRLGSEVDYRQAGEQADRTWMVGADPRSRAAALEAAWRRVAGASDGTPSTLSTQGRTIRVPRGVSAAGGRPSACVFSFKDLCQEPRGAADFIVIARAFDVVMLSDVPPMTLSERNEVRRFITLVDVLYEQRTKLVVSAARPLERIFEARYREPGEDRFAAAPAAAAEKPSASAAAANSDEAFAFDRCTSRLMEMGSSEYLGTDA